MAMKTIYVHQYCRMMRWFSKLEQLYEGAEVPKVKSEAMIEIQRYNGNRPSVMNSRPYDEVCLYMRECEDTIYAFFQNCHHLGDWILNDLTVKADNSKIANEIKYKLRQNEECMKICRHICDGSKHARVTHKPKINAKLASGGESEWFRQGDGYIAKNRYEIEWNGCRRDVLKLAKECIETWNRFMEQHNMEIPKNWVF